jgi:hypothetical protein
MSEGGGAGVGRCETLRTHDLVQKLGCSTKLYQA